MSTFAIVISALVGILLCVTGILVLRNQKIRAVLAVLVAILGTTLVVWLFWLISFVL
jgi:hypothetical protein